ncbi:hybrid sensor histidine kinase/response regulator [Flavobacterium silvisoli]|uniref:histidine kinase n=1 Tax=Flavobacterium silvisoli TaxID=2529433 RepID=A0A4Q9YSQ8_9FLAO|nr:hybrid sensor histidine kinase/response regulator [Flavobacterium silvisoli]TBX66633.1 hybrid sensor histidine kinase/response regulator [Flavobacterium silvisoli]
MPSKYVIKRLYRSALFVLLCFLSAESLSAQLIINNKRNNESFSIHNQTEYIDVEQSNFTLGQILHNKSLHFLPMKSENMDFGFTNHNFWFRFQLVNTTDEETIYFFETARPITDKAELYTIKSNHQITRYQSGDAIPFDKKSFNHRKTIFKIVLQPHEKQQFYLHIKSDGEMLSMPVILHSLENLLEVTSFEQFIFGFFYGILIIAAVLYLFFFFAMRDNTFLYYSMYVVFIGLLQFAVDGYFFQFITPQSGWLSLHAVLLFACVANFFLGRYAQVFLKIRVYSQFLNTAFYVIYVLDFLLLLSLFLIENHQYAYPIANILGLILLLLIVTSQALIYIRTQTIDRFFAVGIFFLISGFVVFILKNFSLLPLTFWTENASKLGTGLEVVFLSLSMANLIRNLKNEREELQTLALQRSEEMNELKSYFLSNISHELRTPLNAIMSLSDTIAAEVENQTVKSNCDVIKYSSKSLLNSVNDILDFSKIEKGELKLEIQPFSLTKSMEHIKNTAMVTSKEKDLEIKFLLSDDLPDNLLGDAIRYEQIANNIINNAIKFTKEGTIKIELTSTPNGENQVKLQLKVTDSGIGIPKEKMNSIFDSFSQESINNKRKFGGLGLGLYIVKNLVDIHNGKVDIRSQQGLGTICTIDLNFETIKDKPKAVIPESNTNYDLKGKRILVVEDNIMNQMVIKMITKNWMNTEVVFANNGEEGVNKLKSNPFDIVLMDLQMPVMDGYEATIAIRKGDAGEENKNIPIIAVTADVMESTKVRVLEIGMNKYLSKPVDKEVLYENIKSLVELAIT